MTKKKINLKDIIDFKKVMTLTKVLCKDYFQNLPIYKAKDSFQGKLFKICVVIAIFGLGYMSLYVIDFFRQTGMPQIFLNAYLLIMALIIMLQQIIASTNIYYFSKDLEYIMPFPIKPIELLVARFNMLISISYFSIIVFILVPLLIYGAIATTSLLYYPGMLIVLITFPIFFALITSIIMLLIMPLSKIIKNKEVFQFVVTFVMTWIFMTFVTQTIISVFSNESIIQQIEQGQNLNIIEAINEKIEYANNYLITINPSVKILVGNNILNNFIELIKILFANLIALIIFVFVGKKLYLKNILRNIEKINSNKIKNKKEKHKYKRVSKEKSYLKNEFKELIKTPTFFMQCVLPVILMVIVLTAIAIAMYPSIIAILQDEEIAEQIPEFKIDISVIAIIIIIHQIIFTFSNLSITAISRKGKSAFFIKYIPMPLYKQFLVLNLPQIILNIFVSVVILGVTKYLVPQISIIYLIAIFAISLILNIINSFLMLIADLRRPNLEWDNETDAIKQNKNKLYQYVLTIIIILILIYFQKIFIKINLNLSIIIILFILIIILFIINKIIKNKINKLFNKIY